MLKDKKLDEKLTIFRKKTFIITFIGTIIMILVILVTLELSHRDVSAFISSQKKYILSIEAAILSVCTVEMMVSLLALSPRHPQMVERGARLRLIVRIIGYFVASASVVSILASNAALGISVGAIAGILIAFSMQNILSSVIAAILILSTRMIRVGEEITISGVNGVVSDINLTHTVLSIEDDVVFIPNSVIVSSLVRRKKRDVSKDADVSEW